jgi:endonuclease/exonuclease/phosphatase family metal-dependent hydrolase
VIGGPAHIVVNTARTRPHGGLLQAAGTFGEFIGRQNGQKIDYVFAEPDVAVHEARIVNFNRDGRYPSDHFPVYAKITLQRR